MAIKIILTNKIKQKNVSLVPQKESAVVLLPSGEKMLSLGIGDIKKLNRRKLILIARQVIASAKINKIKKLTIDFADFVFPHLHLTLLETAQLLAINFEMANFEFTKYKTTPPEGWNSIEEIEISGRIKPEVQRGIKTGQMIGEAVNSCRVLSNTPGGEMTPRILAQEAKQAAKNTAIQVTVLNRSAMQKLRMGGVLGVAHGSVQEPQFIVMEYLHGKKTEKPIVLIGKGVTFDTGGLNLKPSEGIYEMHMDMSGGAAVIQTMILAAKLGFKKNIVGLIPAMENMPSGSSYRPGDILKTMSGKNVEVLNTDAEGRIILADALTYAKKYHPKLVIDVATLTGASLVALGQRASAVFATDQKLERIVRELGEASGEYVWPLPLWEEYEEDIKGTFGDVANVGKTRYGGAITGALFLYQFAKEFPAWVHIDIAPRMTAVEGEYLAKGAAGAPVRLLIKLLEKL